MEFNIKIKSIEKRHDTQKEEWSYVVCADTGTVGVTVIYSGKSPKKAYNQMLRRLPHDLLRVELEARKNELQQLIERE